MKKKIQEVQNYFKARLMSGKFEVKEIQTHVVKLSIEGYDFTIWAGNPEIPKNTKNYEHALSFIDLQLTNEESCKVWDVISPIIKEYHKTTLIAQKEMELEKLKKGL